MLIEKTQTRKIMLTGSLFVFIISLLYATLFVDNLYFDTHGWQDFEFIHDASQLKVSTMINDLFFPGLDFLRGGHAQGVRTRIVEAFILKEINATFGWASFPYFFVKGIIISILSVVLFLHLFKSTQSLLFSSLGTAFFISLPPLWASFLYMYDFDVLAQLFIATVFLLFITHCFKKESYAYHAILIILTLLALKTKASSIIIPAVIFIYLALFSRERIKEYAAFFIIAFIFINPLYPLFQDKGNELGIFPAFDMTNLFQRLFLNKAWDYNSDQTIPTIFSPKDSFVRMPNTVTALFGFFFWWFIIATGVVLLISKIEGIKKQKSLLFYLLWLITVLFFYQFDVSKSPFGTDMRYMTLAAIPALLFAFTLLAYTYKEIQHKKIFSLRLKNIFLTAVIIALFLTVFTNVAQTAVHLKGGYNSRNHANLQLFKLIYEDYYHETVNFYQFAQNNTLYKKKDNTLIQSTFTNYDFLDFGGIDFGLSEQKINDFFKKKANKKAYLVSLGKEVKLAEFKQTNMGIVNPCDAGIFEWAYCVSYQQKNNRPFVFYVSRQEQKNSLPKK